MNTRCKSPSTLVSPTLTDKFGWREEDDGGDGRSRVMRQPSTLFLFFFLSYLLSFGVRARVWLGWCLVGWVSLLG